MLWQTKALTQAVLAALPMGEQLNHQFQRINAVRRGSTIEATRLVEVRDSIEFLSRFAQIEGSTVVEVGTGWDALPTLALSQAGGSVVTFDHIRHLRLRCLQQSACQLGMTLSSDADTDEALNALSIDYRAPADATETELPAGCADIFYSFAVLEHVPVSVVRNLINEARRVLKPGGVFYALIGLHDHFHNFDARVSKVNFLKYPEWVWAPLVKNSISYHNRLRERDFLDMLRVGGAEIIAHRSSTDPEDLRHLDMMSVAKQFDCYSRDELAVTRTEIVARW